MAVALLLIIFEYLVLKRGYKLCCFYEMEVVHTKIILEFKNFFAIENYNNYNWDYMPDDNIDRHMFILNKVVIIFNGVKRLCLKMLVVMV